MIKTNVASHFALLRSVLTRTTALSSLMLSMDESAFSNFVESARVQRLNDCL